MSKSIVSVAASKKSTVVALASKAVASKANAERTAQPGIIAHIMNVLIAARDKKKPVTFAVVLASCEKAFPSRTATGMSVTVRAQLSRLPKQRRFPIVKSFGNAANGDSRTRFYAAGARAIADAPMLAKKVA